MSNICNGTGCGKWHFINPHRSENPYNTCQTVHSVRNILSIISPRSCYIKIGNISNVQAVASVSIYCANYSSFQSESYPPHCQNALYRTAVDELGCCINLFNDVVNKAVLPYFSDDVMDPCEITFPAKCTSDLEIEVRGDQPDYGIITSCWLDEYNDNDSYKLCIQNNCISSFV